MEGENVTFVYAQLLWFRTLCWRLVPDKPFGVNGITREEYDMLKDKVAALTIDSFQRVPKIWDSMIGPTEADIRHAIAEVQRIFADFAADPSLLADSLDEITVHLPPLFPSSVSGDGIAAPTPPADSSVGCDSIAAPLSPPGFLGFDSIATFPPGSTVHPPAPSVLFPEDEWYSVPHTGSPLIPAPADDFRRVWLSGYLDSSHASPKSLIYPESADSCASSI